MNIRKKERGFTLVEMAVVTLIIGIAVAAFGGLYYQYQKEQKRLTTESRLQIINAAIGDYRSFYGRYPCPASIGAVPGDANYGHETNCTENNVTNPAIVAAGACNADYCVRSAVPTRVVNGNVPRIRVGAVPFRSLGLSEEFMYDGYGNRAVLAVTEILADNASFQAGGGGISILNDEEVSAIDPPDTAHYFLFSSGENANGALLANGQKLACGGLSDFETRNCDFTAEAVFQIAQANDNANTFDDQAFYALRSEVPSWQASETDSEDIHLISDTANMAVALEDGRDPEEEAHFETQVRARDNILTNQVCGRNDENCFSPAMIAGYVDPSVPYAEPDAVAGGLECPAGEFMVGIRGGSPVCEDEVFARCPDGQALGGIGADGQIQCAAYGDCDPQSVNVCGENFFVEEVEPGQTILVPPSTENPAGESRRQAFTCQDGNLVQDEAASVGQCCETRTRERTKNCWSARFTGTEDVIESFNCITNRWETQEYIERRCVCREGGVFNEVLNCPSGFNRGDIRSTRRNTCVSGRPQWINEPRVDTCSCEPETQNRTEACGPGFVGNINYRREFSCPSGPDSPGRWGNWVPLNPNACVCSDPPETQTIDRSCPDGQIGKVVERRTFNCATSSWGAWEVLENQPNPCRPPPPGNCEVVPGSLISRGNASGQGPRAGNRSCSCGDNIAVCHVRHSAGNNDNYGGCRCE